MLLKPSFTYEQLEPTRLADAFAASGVVEVELSAARAKLCERLLENVNQVRANRFKPTGNLVLVRRTLSGIALNLYVGVFHPKLMAILAFYVREQPTYQSGGGPDVRLLFRRGVQVTRWNNNSKKGE